MKKINELINNIWARLPKDKWCHISLIVKQEKDGKLCVDSLKVTKIK